MQQRQDDPAFSTVIEIHEDGGFRIHPNVKDAVDKILRKDADDGSYYVDRHGHREEDDAADTGSTRGSSQSIEVQSPGVKKIPARLMAYLATGGTYMCCSDGSVIPDRLEVGAGAACCLFQIKTYGRRSTHLQAYDRSVFLRRASSYQAE